MIQIVKKCILLYEKPLLICSYMETAYVLKITHYKEMSWTNNWTQNFNEQAYH